MYLLLGCLFVSHSGAKKAHDWMVDQVADFFRTTYKVKTQQVVKNRSMRRSSTNGTGTCAICLHMKNVCYLSALVLKNEYTKTVKINIK